MQNLPTLKTRLQREIIAILHQLGDGDLPPSAYDTAWVARIPAEKDPAQPMFPQCLQWLQQHQHSDGSWGSSQYPGYYYDKVICTLSAVVCLQTWQHKGIPLHSYIQRGTQYLNHSMKLLDHHPYPTNGFEILFPGLYQEAINLKVNLVRDDIIDKILLAKERKLQKISFDLAFEKPTTLLFSLEAMPLQVIDWHKALRLQDTNGAFLTSPATTAFAYMHTRDPQCLAYLQQVLERYHHIPIQYPMDLFETAWCLEIISKLNLVPYFETEYNRHINRLKTHWSNTKGISWSSVIDLPDLDDTAVTYYLLSQQQQAPEATVFENFYKDGEVFCFPGELQSSPTHLLHLLEAYNGHNTGLVQAARQQLTTLLNGQWTDKWHLSPYYLTCIAVPSLLQDPCFDVTKIITFILENQRQDGGWGLHLSNAEETAWACMALLLYLPHADKNKALMQTCLQQGMDFLAAGAQQDDYNLWIAKCLYTPCSIVNTLINAVMLRYFINKEKNLQDASC